MGVTPRAVPAWLCRLALGAALAAAAAGCGAARPSGAGSTTSSTVGATSSSTVGATSTTQASVPCGVATGPGVVVTSGPEPCTVTAQAGATIHVVLDRGFRWDDPRSDAGAVVVTAIRRPAAGGLTAELHAAAVGRATVAATGTVACAPGQPCPALARQWSIQVTVVDAGTGSRAVTATEADTGRDYTLHPGDVLDVRLSGPASYTWTEPASSAPDVLLSVSGSSGVQAAARLVAVGAGTATVTATDNPDCYPKCLAASRLFEVRVSVTR